MSPLKEVKVLAFLASMHKLFQKKSPIVGKTPFFKLSFGLR